MTVFLIQLKMKCNYCSSQNNKFGSLCYALVNIINTLESAPFTIFSEVQLHKFLSLVMFLCVQFWILQREFGAIQSLLLLLPGQVDTVLMLLVEMLQLNWRGAVDMLLLLLVTWSSSMAVYVVVRHECIKEHSFCCGLYLALTGNCLLISCVVLDLSPFALFQHFFYPNLHLANCLCFSKCSITGECMSDSLHFLVSLDDCLIN